MGAMVHHCFVFMWMMMDAVVGSNPVWLWMNHVVSCFIALWICIVDVVCSNPWWIWVDGMLGSIFLWTVIKGMLGLNPLPTPVVTCPEQGSIVLPQSSECPGVFIRINDGTAEPGRQSCFVKSPPEQVGIAIINRILKSIFDIAETVKVHSSLVCEQH
jgi:hypothetical protein